MNDASGAIAYDVGLSFCVVLVLIVGIKYPGITTLVLDAQIVQKRVERFARHPVVFCDNGYREKPVRQEHIAGILGIGGKFGYLCFLLLDGFPTEQISLGYGEFTVLRFDRVWGDIESKLPDTGEHVMGDPALEPFGLGFV
jgi:hypothetical protein